MSLLTIFIGLNRQIWIGLLLAAFILPSFTAVSRYSEPLVVFTNVFGLETLNLDTLTTHNIYSNGHNVFDIDSVWQLNDEPQIFWSDFQERKIFRATLSNNSQDLTDVQVVVRNGIGAVEGITVDWIASNLYWIESRFGQIEVINLDTMSRTILVMNLESPRAIAVDSAVGLLFWTDWNRHAPRIERCSMSGRERTVIVDILELTIGLGGLPNGLTLDYNLQRVYWIDAKSNSIHSCNYNGLDRTEVMTNHHSIEWPFGMSLFENSLFWVDARLKTVNKMNVANVSDVQVLYETYQTLYGITVVHSNRQPLGLPNPCVNNGGCSHLCTIDLNGLYVCHCPQTMTLSNDQKTCNQMQQVVLVSEQRKDSNFILGFHVEESKFQQITSPIVASLLDSHMFGPELDMLTWCAYWADGHTNTVWKASVTDGSTSRVLDLGFGNLTGFAADFMNKKIYYSMLGPHCGIFSCSLSNFRCVRILENVADPLSVVVQSATNQLYWAEEQNGFSVIRTTDSVDGGAIQNVVDIPLADFNGFTMDNELTLFWIANNSVNRFHNGKQSVLANLNATGKATSLTSTSDELIVSVDDHYVYSLNKITGRQSPVLYRSRGKITAVRSVERRGNIQRFSQNSSLPLPMMTISIVQPTVDCRLTCHNGGECRTDQTGRSYCECKPGFKQTTNCAVNPCDGFCRNGHCSIEVDGEPRCHCKLGFYGQHCEFDLCSNFCIHGKCNISKELHGRPTCLCPSDYWGHRCQFSDVDSVATSPSLTVLLCDYYCLNGGTCALSVDHVPQCSCQNAYSGLRCEMDNSTEERTVGALIFMLAVVIVLALGLVAVLVGQERWKKVLQIRTMCAFSAKRNQLDKNFNKCKEMHIMRKKQPSVSCPTHDPQSDQPRRKNGTSGNRQQDCDRILLINSCQDDDIRQMTVVKTNSNADEFIV